MVRAVIGTLDDIECHDRGPEGEQMEWFSYVVEKFEGYQRKKFEGNTPIEEGFLRKYFPPSDGQ